MNNYVVCIGTKDDKLRVRCVKMMGNIYYPPYGKEPLWKPYSESSIEIYCSDINNINAIIPNNKTQITAYQCWSIASNTYHLTVSQFFNLLTEISDSNNFRLR